MSCHSVRFSVIIAWLILVAVACHTEAIAVQGPDAPAFGPAVKQKERDVENVEGKKLSSFLLPIERALQGIQRRAAGDRSLKLLANEPIVPVDYTDAEGEPKGYRRALRAPTDDHIEIPTKGDAVSKRRPGSVAVHIEVRRRDIQEVISGGLYNGAVTWRTNNPHVFVKLFWCSQDPGVPDRLLTIVREELEREGLRLLPMHKLDRPVATTSERLSQLLPLDSLPPVAPPPKTEVASPQGPAKVFASPYDVVAAHNQAVAKKDWQAYARCLTPASQGAVIREVLFLAAMGGKKCPELIKTIEKHLKFKLIDASDFPGTFVQSKEAEEFLESMGKQPGEDAEAADAGLYEVFRKRVSDVPAFLADCFRQLPGPPEGYGKPIECEGIRIGGDKASGYWIDRRPVPDSKEAEERDVLHYLPRYFPIRFRRIGGSWLIVSMFGHDE